MENRIEKVIKKHAGNAMDFHVADGETKYAMDYLKNIDRLAMKGQGEFSEFTMVERREIRKELNNWWKAIAVNGAGICDLFRG